MKTIRMKQTPSRAAALTLLLSSTLLTACVPLVVGSAVVGGALVATDRRTSGAQLEDQGIELRAANRLREQLVEKSHISVTSYNRKVLLTGEVPSEDYKARAEKIVRGIDNVVEVYNELVVGPNSSVSDRTNDALISSRVRSALIDAKDIYANAVTVTTERSITYVMGRVTEREAARITEIVSGTKGVFKVVRILDIISEEALKYTLPQKPAPNPTASVPAGAAPAPVVPPAPAPAPAPVTDMANPSGQQFTPNIKQD